ncbi:hypothetical protein ABMA28_004162 [Loxostege sticticalis]|uniref:Odorant receptor n=1 Tax=Loxostege sticticalis TaxID=481309 RepID=A0ABD0SX12_LOXSC
MEDLNAYPEEIVKPLLVTLGCFKNCNIYVFDTKSSFWAKYWQLLYKIPLGLFYYYGLCMYVVKLFVEGISPFEEADIIPIWLVANQEFIFKFTIMMKNRKQVRAIIEHLGSVWRTADLSEEQLKTKNSLLKLFNKSANILAWQYILMPLAETLIRKIFLGQETEFRLIFTWVPFAVDNWLTYLAMYAFLGYTHYLMVYLYLGSYLLLLDLTTYISIQFKLLQEDVMNIRPMNNRKKGRLDSDDDIDDEITECGERSGCTIEEFIKRHQDTILLIEELNAIFHKIIFINLLVATLVICFFAIAAKISTGTAYIVTYYFALVHIMATMYIICYCSDMLSTSSTGIAESAVKNLWYEGDLRYQRTMCFIIMRSQEPCTLISLYFPISCFANSQLFYKMEDLNAYPEEFVKTLLVSLGYYRNCNIVFFDRRSSFWARYWRFIYIIPFNILYYMCFLMYIVKMFTEGIGPFQEVNIIPLWLVANQEFLKCIIMIRKRKNVRAIIEHLGSIWRTTDLSEEQLKTKNSTLKLFNKGTNILAWQYVLLPLAETLIRIFFLSQEAKFALLFAYVPFEVTNWPTYLAVYAFQCYTQLFMINMYLGSYLLLVDLSTYISLQFTLLQDDVINIRPTNNRKYTTFSSDDGITEYGEGSECNFEKFIKRHQDIILLTEELNAIYNKKIFINLVVSTLVISFFAIAAKVSTGTAYAVINYFAIFQVMVTLYIMCYCSEMLSASSTGIAESAVKNLWYEGDLRYRRTMCFIIMRSQEPCTLRSLYFPISISMTFNTVLKTTYSYFSVANHLYERRD